MLESMDSGNGIFEYCFVLNNSFILRKENILLVLDNLQSYRDGKIDLNGDSLVGVNFW